MKILIASAAGFIGMHVAKRLLRDGHKVIGLDNLNDYYDVKLKRARIKNLEIHKDFSFIKLDIADYELLRGVFSKTQPNSVCNLAAQAGVRYSIENPHAYIKSNVVGFTNILECSREFRVEHLVYASSSSVYGLNAEMPFRESQNTDHPLALYGATKKSNEVMAHAYSHLFGLPTTGLRFFTVYGPWGRPDMALYKFADAIINDRPIDVYNEGEMIRDFTYIDDIVESVVRIIAKPAAGSAEFKPEKPAADESNAPWKLFNIGNGQPVALMDYIKQLGLPSGKLQIRTLWTYRWVMF